MPIILDHSSKLRDCHDIDNILSAEIPNEVKDQHLHQIINHIALSHLRSKQVSVV